MLPLQTRVGLGVMAMKGFSVFPNAPVLLEPYHQIVQFHIHDTFGGGGVISFCREAVSPSQLGNKVNLAVKSNEILEDERVHQLCMDRDYVPRHGWENLTEIGIKMKSICHDKRFAQGQPRQSRLCVVVVYKLNCNIFLS